MSMFMKMKQSKGNWANKFAMDSFIGPRKKESYGAINFEQLDGCIRIYESLVQSYLMRVLTTSYKSTSKNPSLGKKVG